MLAKYLLIYSFISGAVLTLLWIGYRVSGLNKLTCFRLNRSIIAASLLLSLLLPFAAFIERPVEPVAVPVGVVEFGAPTFEIIDAAEPDTGFSIDWPVVLKVASIIYVVGLCASLLWLAAGIAAMCVNIACGSRQKLPGGATLVLHNRDVMPFTWGNWIVMSRADYESSGDILLCHEQAHRTAAHWADLLLARIVSAINWYWPSSWIFNRDLAEVHEFEADSKVVEAGFARAQYQMLLISKGAPTLYSNIVNPLNYSSLKTRIIMMQKRKTPAGARKRALVLLPFAAFVTYMSVSPALASSVEALKPAPTPEQMDLLGVSAIAAAPEVGISATALLAPAAAYEALPNDTVYAAKGTEPLDEVIVVSYSAGPLSGATVSHADDSAADKNPLIIVDGERVPYSMLKTIPSERIASMAVLKDQAAMAKYNAPNGVIIVTTKSDSDEPTNPNSTPAVTVMPGTTPQFPGGEQKLYEYLSRNVRYPEEAAKANMQGRVVVKFTVGKDGSIGEAQIVRSQGELLDNEALRVVRAMPKFEPATKNGEPVAAWYTLPIQFKLQGPTPASAATPAPGVEVRERISEEKPQFEGGDEALFSFIAKNMRYPEEAVKANAQGRVIVTFKINKDGSVSDAKVVRNSSGNEALANEALRITGELPNFIPGKRNGEPVAVWYTLPYNFKME